MKANVRVPIALLAATGALLVGCPEPVGEDLRVVHLTGAVQKGPFLLGSTITISAVDASGSPTGQVFNTMTTDDLGQFNVEFAYLGLVSLEGDGFYYNELTGALSDAQLTLRALHGVDAAGAQNVYINLITHLSYGRVKALLAVPMALDAAVAQAEGELRVALGVGPSGFDPGASGVQMNILGGDTDPNAYVFAVSAVLVQAAVTRAGPGGPVDATLQELLNNISSDLADDGAISSTLELAAAQAALDPDQVMAHLADRLAAVGSSAAVPDINRIIDSDLDGIANAFDNCRSIANLDQTDSDGNGMGDPCDCSDGIKGVSDTDVDCGGTCPACPDGKACGVAADCSGGGCCGNVCLNVTTDPLNCGACGAKCPSSTMTCSVTGCSSWVSGPMPNPAGTGLPNPASYDTSTPGVVIDNVTGLWWQEPIDVDNNQGSNCSAGCPQAAAIAYCANLTLAGHSDWRVPTRIELVSIVDFSTENPAINVTAFPSTPQSEDFWTSSARAGAPGSAWAISFYYSFTDGYDVDDWLLRVRCVR